MLLLSSNIPQVLELENPRCQALPSGTSTRAGLLSGNTRLLLALIAAVPLASRLEYFVNVQQLDLLNRPHAVGSPGLINLGKGCRQAVSQGSPAEGDRNW